MDSPLAFVIGSSVRRDIVMGLSEGAAPTDELLGGIEASDSAVYDALSTLADRGLLSEVGDAWELSARGQLVGEAIDQWQSWEVFLAIDPEFWERHDASVIPPAFRRRLPEIGEYEVVRSDESGRTRHHQATLSRYREADYCWILARFFSVEYQNAVPDVPETRLLIHPTAVDGRAERIRNGLNAGQDLEEAQARLTDCEFAMSVGEGFVTFGLPAHTAERTTATLVSETEGAVQWARELFEAQWELADSIETYAAREYPDIWDENGTRK